MADVVDVADYVAGAIEVSPLKLQKLLYYIQAVSLVRTGVPMFKEKIEAWDYGPVIRRIYDRYRDHGNGIIPRKAVSTGKLTPDEIISADLVIAYYGKKDPTELIRETHSERPWIEAYEKGRNNVITTDAMKNYYSEIYTIA